MDMDDDLVNAGGFLVDDKDRQIAELEARIVELERYDSDDEIRCLKDDNDTLREEVRQAYSELQDQIARNLNLEGKLKALRKELDAAIGELLDANPI